MVKTSAYNVGDLQRQPTPIYSPGEFHGQQSLVRYSPWVLKELKMTEQRETFYCLLGHILGTIDTKVSSHTRNYRYKGVKSVWLL